MTKPRHIDRLSEIADGFDAMLCDAWGVIHDGVTLFDGVAEALQRFRAGRGPVVILTNAPRPSSIIPAQLDRIGLPRDAYDAIVTSGDATRAAIAAHLPAPAYKLGPEKDEALYDGLDIAFAPLDEAAFIICTGMVDDQRDQPEDYADMLAAAAARKLPMICANPDIVVRWGGRIIYCAGALAQMYQNLGGAVIYGGKPHTPIYELALKAAALNSPSGAAPEATALARARVLAVGDGVKTDIAGANAHGLPALFVAGDGGVHDGASDADGIEAALAAAGVHAQFAATRLVW
ncbi:MAG: TIGR01459 family HAD-type hydrolase [Parvularculaceae bacterium]